MPEQRRADRDGLYIRVNSPYYWASYTDGSGRRVRRSTGIRRSREGRRAAQALLAEWRLESAQERRRAADPSCAGTFDELMLAYLPASERRKRPGTVERDRISAKHLYRKFTGRDMATLNRSDVNGYVEARERNGVAAGTINRELGLLSAAVTYGQRTLGWAIENPVAGCRLREPEGRVRYLNDQEYQRLINAARRSTTAPYLVDFIVLGVNTGCRRNELLRLTWPRVDLERHKLFLEAEHTKTRRRRAVPLNADAIEALERRLNWNTLHCADTQWVFAKDDGSNIGSVRRAFENAVARAGLVDFHIHDLRHTFASWLVMAGVELIVVRDLLGHSTIAMTERYAHLAPECGQHAVSRLGHFGYRDEGTHAVVTLESH